jgi:hypothetical protein
MTGPHPYWCRQGACNAIGATGAHRSMPTIVEGFAVNLIADATTPGAAMVELRCGPALLAPRDALTIGRLLVSLSRAVDGSAPR